MWLKPAWCDDTASQLPGPEGHVWLTLTPRSRLARTCAVWAPAELLVLHGPQGNPEAGPWVTRFHAEMQLPRGSGLFARELPEPQSMSKDQCLAGPSEAG